MLGKTSPKTVTLLLRLNPNTPEAMVVKYCRDRTISSANQMLQRAINAFYLPLAFLENGKLSLYHFRIKMHYYVHSEVVELEA